MKGDFSRSTFRPLNHYRGVLMQQGRVQLDADWNENLEVLLHRIETETLDVIGQCGVPIHNAAFGVVTDFTTLSPEEQALLTDLDLDDLAAGDFYLTRGRAYVDGILVENEQTLPFSHQPYVLPSAEAIGDPGIYLLYLDVWLRHITAIEDPDIREIALGGPDTATRAQIVWQARLAKAGEVGDTVTCADDLAPWPGPSTGKLQARTHPEDLPEDPCVVPPGAGYKRLENQLYRVEIHEVDPGTGAATFKWSRDNGSIAVPISEFGVDGSDDKIRTTSLGRDDVLGLHEQDWVEVLDDATELAGLPGKLVKIDKIDPDNILTLSEDVTGFDLAGHPKVRRWDCDDAQDVTVPGTNDGYLPLEGGVEIKFELGQFRTGDYWLIPARTVPGQYGDIQWLQDGSDPAALLPFGILHHYCKLAVITAEMVGDSITITDVEDCRHKFPPLTELPEGGECCCSVTVGANGDYPDIPSALAARPPEAKEWHVCVKEGEHAVADTVLVTGLKGLTISGCGRQTHLIGPAGKAVFAFSEVMNVQLDGLWIDASSPQGAILFAESSGVVVSNCLALNRAVPVGAAPASLAVGVSQPGYGQPLPLIVVDACQEVEIRDNQLLGLPAVLADGKQISVLRNRIMGGGVQIAPPASIVAIEDNVILKGAGPGIRLGGGEKGAVDMWTMKYGDSYEATGVRTSPAAKNLTAGIELVTISRNLIGAMAGSGIVTELSLLEVAKLGDVEYLTVSDNQIVSCAAQPDVALSGTVKVGGGMALMGVFSTRIENNFVAANGRGDSPACGVFVLDGSDVDLDGNTIVENGVAEGSAEPTAYQAGIAAQYMFGNFLGVGRTQSGKMGYPALRVHDNRVICPAGQALSIVASGSVHVDGNTLASREKLDQPSSPLMFGEKGGCVFIFDLGLPVWLTDIALLLQMLTSGQTGLHLEDNEPVENAFSRFPDGRVLFHNNQVTFDTEQVEDVASLGPIDNGWAARAWSAAVFSALFFSLDDVSLVGNQFQATVPLYMLIGLQKYQQGQIPAADLIAYWLKFIQVGSLATAVRASANGLTERLFSNGVSYASVASAMSVTTSNEATHLYATAAPKKAQADNLSLTS